MDLSGSGDKASAPAGVGLFIYLRQFITRTRDSSGSDHASVTLFDEESGEYAAGASTIPEQSDWLSPLSLRREGGSSAWMIKERRPILVEDIRELSYDPNPMLEAFGIRSYLGVPLLQEDRVLGILYLLNRMPQRYTQEQVENLRALAVEAAAELVNFNFREEILKSSLQGRNREYP